MRINRLSKIIHFGFSYKRFHQILGISINATPQQIKAAYYQKAKQHHPDLNPTESGVHFNQIRNAYDQLIKKSNSTSYKQQATKKQQKSQSKAKQRYDREYQNQFYQWTQNNNGFHNKNKNKKHQNQEASWNFEEEQVKQFEKAFNSFLRHGYLKNKYMKFAPIFQQMFRNDGFNKHQQQFNEQDFSNQFGFQQEYDQQQVNSKVKNKHRLKKLDISQTIDITQDQIGENIKIKFQREVNCHKCTFNSEQNYVRNQCKSCHKGQLLNGQKCPKCKGRGYLQKYECKSCKNKGYLRKTFQQMVIIPLGLKDGEKVIISGRGNQHRRRGTFGDLVISINIVSNKEQIKRKHKKDQAPYSNKNIKQIDISIFEAVLGCIATVRSNKGVSQIKVPPGVQHGDIIKNNDNKKDLYQIKVNFTIPNKVSKKQKIIYEKLRILNMKKSEQL